MTIIRFTKTTTATPEQFVAALTDFGPGRRELFGNSSDKYLKVHSKDAEHADVTEGATGIWERLEYDWSDPHRVVMTTVDSNLWGGRSAHVYSFTPLPDGTTRLDVEVTREGRNLQGRLTAVLVGSVGKGVLEKALQNTIKAVEARNR
ncbi:MAG TPA: SRPBCC family protein [Actinocrinis sp.]|nr:SRPBCC family protein [Actinocrinis sp.]